MIGKYRIGVCGTHCAGKTTLVEALNKILEYPKIVEIASRFPRDKRRHMKTQLDIMSAQISEEIGVQHFISDRTVIDNLAYSTLCFVESVRDLTNMSEVFIQIKEYMICMGLGTDYLSSRPYDLIVFVDEMLPLENDGNRCLNQKYQEWIFDFMKVETGLVNVNYRMPVIDVRGTTEDRVKSVIDSLTNLDKKLSHSRSIANAKKLISNRD